MKSTTFVLDPSAAALTKTEVGNVYAFKLPLLLAFAIEYYTLQFGALSTFPSDGDSLVGDTLTVTVMYPLDDMDSRVAIFYHGIRDYRLLFPTVTSATLQARLGEFYREAEAAFDSASWLTFMLMCGALFEGILFFKLGVNQSFNQLIQAAIANGTIDATTASIMNTVRGHRNLVHANRHTEAYVTRAEAMDTRITLDRLLRTI